MTCMCKTAEPIEMPFGLWAEAGMGPRSHALERSRSPMGKGNFEEKGRPVVKYRDTELCKTAEPMSFGWAQGSMY